MKTLRLLSLTIISLATNLTYTNSASAFGAPPAALFEKTSEQARKLGYFGYDVMVCLAKNNQMLVGGVSFWNTPLQIFLVADNGAVTATKRVSPPTETIQHRFIANGQPVALYLGTPTYKDGLEVYAGASLSVGTEENVPFPLTCYQQNSGLESVQP